MITKKQLCEHKDCRFGKGRQRKMIYKKDATKYLKWFVCQGCFVNLNEKARLKNKREPNRLKRKRQREEEKMNQIPKEKNRVCKGGID